LLYRPSGLTGGDIPSNLNNKSIAYWINFAAFVLFLIGNCAAVSAWVVIIEMWLRSIQIAERSPPSASLFITLRVLVVLFAVFEGSLLIAFFFVPFPIIVEAYSIVSVLYSIALVAAFVITGARMLLVLRSLSSSLAGSSRAPYWDDQSDADSVSVAGAQIVGHSSVASKSTRQGVGVEGSIQSVQVPKSYGARAGAAYVSSHAATGSGTMDGHTGPFAMPSLVLSDSDSEMEYSSRPGAASSSRFTVQVQNQASAILSDPQTKRRRITQVAVVCALCSFIKAAIESYQCAIMASPADELLSGRYWWLVTCLYYFCSEIIPGFVVLYALRKPSASTTGTSGSERLSGLSQRASVKLPMTAPTGSTPLLSANTSFSDEGFGQTMYS
jgi:hypothetical protein